MMRPDLDALAHGYIYMQVGWGAAGARKGVAVGWDYMENRPAL